MKKPAVPENETLRLQLLRQYDVLDTPPEEAFDRITRIASAIADMPVALVSLIDEDRQWFKSRVGLDSDQTSRDVSFCGHAIMGQEEFEVRDARNDSRFADNPLVTGEPGIRFYFGVPLQVPGGVNVGTLCVLDRRPRSLSNRQREALNDLAKIVVRELEHRKAALKDPLTNAYNRRMLSHMADQEIARAERSGRWFCFAAIDLDHFKRINDTYGHEVGDKVLLETARTCWRTMRDGDVLFRLGGEEFGMLLPDTELDRAIPALERIRENIQNQEILTDEGHIVRVTVSIGASALRGNETDFDSLMKRADRNLYTAKRDGRNRTVIKS